MHSYYKSTALIALLLILSFSASVSIAQTIKGRAVVQATPENQVSLQIPNTKGDNLMLVHFKGLMFLDNDEVARIMGTETLHFSKESGSYQGYEVLTFKDGSTIMSKIKGTNQLSENGQYVDFNGSFEYTRGTGRFEGISGSGTHSGRNYIAWGVGGYYDIEGSYSLSSN